MPLVKSSSKKALGKNIAAEVKSGKSVRQSAAIAFHVQRDARAKQAKRK